MFYFNCQRPKETTEGIFAHLPWSRHLKDNLVTCLNLNYTTLALIHSSKALTISVHLVDHVLQFGFCWVLAQRPHDGSKFLGCDGAITVFVKKGESFLEFSNLLFGQLISHGASEAGRPRERGWPRRGRDRRAPPLQLLPGPRVR